MLIPIGFLGGGAPAGAYELISTTILGSDTASVSFSSIASTYKHLELRLVARTNAATTNANLKMNFNSDTGSNYAWHRLEGDGSTVSSDNFASMTYTAPAQIAGTTVVSAWPAAVISIADYASTTKNKTLRALAGWSAASTPRIRLGSGLWISTSAISAILLTPSTGSFLAGSRFSLYGIKGA